MIYLKRLLDILAFILMIIAKLVLSFGVFILKVLFEGGTGVILLVGGLTLCVIEAIVFSPIYYIATGKYYYEEFYNPLINAIDNLMDDNYKGKIFKWRKY